jgi:thermitase
MRLSCVGVKATWGLGAASFAGIAFCFTPSFTFAGAATPQELIVRYREPQNNLWQANLTAQSTVGKVERTEVLNSSEGVLKLRFKSAAEANQAMARLQLSDDVLSVSPNHLYSLAVSYTSRDVTPAKAAQTFLAVPFLSLDAPAALPEVALPPAGVTVGADPLVAQDWAMTKIGMPESLDGTGLKPVTAAVLDTGIDYNHEDLSGSMWRQEGKPQIVGYDFAQNNDRPFDVVHFDIEGCLKDVGCQMGWGQGKFLTNPGHGTHCAGHVSAVANNSLGIRGVGAGATQVMALKFFFDKEHANAGQGDTAGAIKSIDYAVKNGAKVINASWGGRQEPSVAERSELKQALIRAQKAGVIVVVAAGNDTIDQDKDDEPTYPAAYKLDNLIVVAATDKNDALGKFSNYGGESVHIGAPGVKILSTTSGSQYSDVVKRYKDPSSGKDREIAWNGTSMAAPIVAGAVALVWAKYPSESYQQIRARILSSARKVEGLSGKVVTGGVLDVAAALK